MIKLILAIFFGAFSLLPVYAIECADKQECFPENSSTWHVYENKKIIKRINFQVKSKEHFFLKEIKSSDLRRSLRGQFKISAELSIVECEILGETSGAGAHWPGVWSGVCQISYLERHLANIKIASECLKGSDVDVGQCLSSF